jgi:hypothetical protein
MPQYRLFNLRKAYLLIVDTQIEYVSNWSDRTDGKVGDPYLYSHGHDITICRRHASGSSIADLALGRWAELLTADDDGGWHDR